MRALSRSAASGCFIFIRLGMWNSTGRSSARTIPLLPQFTYTETPTDAGAGSGDTAFTLQNAGEFYVGFEALQPGQSVSALFQVLEGSTDPLVLKPEPHLYYSYLANNQWKPLRRTAVSDSTRGLIQSGLMEFSIADDATTDNTLLPSGHVWFRISVDRPSMPCASSWECTRRLPLRVCCYAAQ